MIIAIDSGGTKTKILASDDKGNITYEAYAKGFGKAVDNADDPIKELENAIRCIPYYDKAKKIIVNLGGKNSSQVENILKGLCPDALVKVFRESSGIIGNFMREKIGADVMIFAGTGAITLGGYEGRYFVSDGWGRDIGDCGSGYYIGLSAIKKCLNAIEEDEITPFVTAITGQTHPFGAVDTPDGLMGKRDEVRKNILPLERDKVASFTKVAAEHARLGDKIAIEIFEDVGICLAKTAQRVLVKIGKCDGVKISVTGGVSNSVDLWEEAFEKYFESKYENFELFVSEVDFAQGTLLYGLKNL